MSDILVFGCGGVEGGVRVYNGRGASGRDGEVVAHAARASNLKQRISRHLILSVDSACPPVIEHGAASVWRPSPNLGRITVHGYYHLFY
jgi:hypothetical protein